MQQEATFGEWLRYHRKLLDLTQWDLAERVGCSGSTIQKIEDGVRRPSKQVAELLADLLGVAPADRDALVHWARSGPGIETAVRDIVAGTVPLTVTPTPTADTWSGGSSQDSRPAIAPANIPPMAFGAGRLPAPLTQLLGRERELAELRDYLARDEVRLLSLTGAPGIGKTRLAIEAASRAGDLFEDGIYFVSLAAINDPDLVLPTIAQVIGASGTGGQDLLSSIGARLHRQRALLLLDNFEQVLDAAPHIAELLAICSRLKVVVTSREALHTYGEWRFPVSPLQIPAWVPVRDLEVLAGVPSVALFLERARAELPNFSLTPDNAQAVAAICARLDGLPLAIELAAARIKLLPPKTILTRLETRLDLLTGGARNLPRRQQTLRNAIEWSYDLLDPSARMLFRRLDVFVGGWTLDAAEAVCNADGAFGPGILQAMGSLVDNSLLVQSESPEGDSRFDMLQTIREYAREKLGQSGEAEAVQREHALYFTALAREVEPHLTGAHQQEWFERLEAEHDNLRAVERWTLATGAIDLALSLAAALLHFWEVHGHWSEGLAWLEALLAHPGATARTPARARALLAAARMTHWVRNASEGRGLVEEALAISGQHGDRATTASALMMLANIRLEEGTPSEASQLYQEALTTAREGGDLRTSGVALLNLCYVYQLTGDLGLAERYGQESLAILQRLGDDFSLGSANGRLGEIALATGRPALAQMRFEDALGLLTGLAHVPGRVALHALLARALAEQDRLEEARQHLISALHLLRETHETRRLPSVLTEAAHLLLARGAEREAAVLLTWAEAQQRTGPTFEGPTAGAFLAALQAQTEAELDPTVLGAARAEDKGLTPDEAIDQALDDLQVEESAE